MKSPQTNRPAVISFFADYLAFSPTRSFICLSAGCHTFSPARKYAKSRRETFRRPRCSALPAADAAEHKRVPRSVCDAGEPSPRSTPGTANGTPGPFPRPKGEAARNRYSEYTPLRFPLMESPPKERSLRGAKRRGNPLRTMGLPSLCSAGKDAPFCVIARRALARRGDPLHSMGFPSLCSAGKDARMGDNRSAFCLRKMTGKKAAFFAVYAIGQGPLPFSVISSYHKKTQKSSQLFPNLIKPENGVFCQKSSENTFKHG